MFNKKFDLLFCFFAVCCLGALAAVFYRSLGSLHFGLRALLVCAAVTVFALAGLLAVPALRHLGKVKYWASGATLLFGVILYISFDPKAPSADYATVSFSNGKQVEGVKPDVVDAWGRLANGYNMHPAYNGAVVQNSLVATFLSRPREVKVLFSKPSYALVQPNGKPTQSDGISAILNAFDENGHLGYSTSVVISQEDFLKSKWIEKAIQMDAGIASVQVTVGSGPEGATPYYDSTILAFNVSNWRDSVEFVGVVVLLCVGFFVLVLFAALNIRSCFVGFRRRDLRVSWPTYFSFGLVFLFLMLVAYWSESRTVSVYYWDSRNYWEKTETLYALLKSGAGMQAISMFLANYTSDYSFLPAVGPALLSLVTGSPTRVNYTLSITLLYAFPAYIMLAYLARRVVDGESLNHSATVKTWWALSSFPIIFGLSNFFGTTLLLMPDIGGVVLFAGALLSAFTLQDAIRREESQDKPWHISLVLLRASISLGVLFSLMFIFRRWYVFAVAGISISLFIIVLTDIIRAGMARDMMFRAVASAILMASAALPFLAWVVFSWSRDFGQHDYSNLYASYRFPMSRDMDVFKTLFGLAVPLLSIVAGIVLYVTGRAKRLMFLLTVSSCLAWLLFYVVQSPSRHHFMLLMPMFGVFLAGLSILIARRFGFMASVGLTVILVVGGGLATRTVSDKYHTSLFSSFDDWLPQHQVYLSGYTELFNWLASEQNMQKKFCVIASNGAINQGIFAELWQIMPGVSKHVYDQRLVQLGQVDTVDGPPKPVVKECEIFLVGVPFLSHLRPGQQLTLEIIQQDILNGTGIGRAVDPIPKVFPMGADVEMRAYRVARKITDDEYENLVKRFMETKAAADSTSVK